jgi:transcriptional regulator with XRE-family HTH domain
MSRPIDDEELRALIEAGISQREIARRLGIPRSTLQDRVKRLNVAPARREASAPVQRPVQALDTGAVQALDTGAVQALDTGAVQALDTGAVQRLDRLEGELQGLRYVVQSLVERLDQPPVQTPVQITALPPFPPGKAVRWNLWILDAIRDELAALAAERGVSPSQLVQELLWKALNNRSP